MKNQENNDDSQTNAFGMRDILLVKCKQAIEELHSELDDEKKIKTQNEEKISILEKEILEKDSRLREFEHAKQKMKGLLIF